MPADAARPLLPSIKLLTVKQPWAELIARGTKPIETRTWRTHYRGLVAIHAGLAKPSKADFNATDAAQRHGVNFRAIDYGTIIAVARLADCAPMTTDDEEAACVPARPGLWAWRIADIRRLRDPIPFKGAMGLTDVPPHILRRLHE